MLCRGDTDDITLFDIATSTGGSLFIENVFAPYVQS